MEDLEPFYPDRMAGRILGMGDVLSFVEKAQEVVSVILISFIAFRKVVNMVLQIVFRCNKKMPKHFRRR